MNTENLYVLAINSLPANGNAGLKMAMSILGTHVIPVPTLLLSGIGNMPGHQRYPVPFEAMLGSTLTLARQNGYSLVVYVGYLGDASQASTIAHHITDFADIIQYVVIDPVCGDNGRAYVADAIINSWHHLLAVADIALPNITEIALLTGVREGISPTETDTYVTAFRHRYPALECIITGLVSGPQISNRWLQPDRALDFPQPYHPAYFSGTGDTFASLFIWFFCFRKLPKEQAIREAGRCMEAFIRQSVEAGRPDLMLSPDLTLSPSQFSHD